MDGHSAGLHLRTAVGEDLRHVLEVGVAQDAERKEKVEGGVRERVERIVGRAMADQPAAVALRLQPRRDVEKVHRMHAAAGDDPEHGAGPRAAPRAEFQHDAVGCEERHDGALEQVVIRTTDGPLFARAHRVGLGARDIAAVVAVGEGLLEPPLRRHRSSLAPREVRCASAGSLPG
jgi:hypothetical protein